MKRTKSKNRSAYHKGVITAVAFACAGIGSAYAGTPNTLSTYTGGAALDSASDWLPQAIPGMTNDALIGPNYPTSAAGTNYQTSIGTSQSFGTLDITNISTNINFYGAAGSNTVVNSITLGAGGVDANGNLIDSNAVSGASPNDLVYMAQNAYLNVRTGTGDTLAELNLANSGNFDIVSGGTLVTNNAITGVGPIIKTGTGTLNLSTNKDTFTGGVNLASGTLVITGSLSLGAAPSVATTQLLFSGTSTLQFSGAATTGAKSAISLANSATGTIDTQTYTISFQGPISGGGSLAKVGSGVLNLNTATANNYNYSGSTSVNGGLLQLGAAVVIPSTPLIMGGGNFQLSSGYSVAQNFSNFVLTTNTSSAVVTTTFSGGSLALGAINRSGGSLVDFTLPGAGSITTTTSNATNSVSGPANIIGGYATVNGQTNWATSAATGGSPGAITGLTTYDSTLTVAGADVDVQPTSALTTPVAVVNSLRFNSSSSLAITAAGTFTIASGGILITANAGSAANSITGGTITSNGGDLEVIQGNTGPFTIGSTIVDPGVNNPMGLIKAGPGTLYLSSANTFTGPTNVYGGIVVLLNQYALQNSTFSSNVSGTSLVFDSSVTSNAFNLGGINTVNALALQNNSGTPIVLTFGSSNVSTNITGVVSGAGTLIKTGTGTTYLTGTNTYTGSVIINGGLLRFSNSAWGPSTLPIIINNTGGLYYNIVGTSTLSPARSIDLGAGTETIQSGSTTNSTNTSGTSLLVIGQAGNSSSGIIAGPAIGVANLIKTGLGTLQINSNSTYNGSTIVEAGIVAVASPLGLGVSTLGGSYNGSGPLIINSPAGFYSQVNFQTSSAAVSSLSSVFSGNASAGINSLVLGVPTIGGTTALSVGADGKSTTYSGNISDLNSSYSGAVGTIIKVGTGTLTLSGSNTYAGGTNVTSGTVVFSGAAAFPSGSNLSIGSLATVAAANVSGGVYALKFNTLTNGGLLDIGQNAAVIHTGSSLTTLTNQVFQGYSHGSWNGSAGITSSAAAADTTHRTAVGIIVNDNGSGTALYGSGATLGSFDNSNPVDGDLLVKYTYYGDANLDGNVDGSDYSLIDSSYLAEKSGGAVSGWYNGDFNYDGVVNGSDYTLIDNAFNSQGASLASVIGSPLAVSTAEVAAVPEPATISVLALGAVGMLGSRRRRK